MDLHDLRTWTGGAPDAALTQALEKSEATLGGASGQERSLRRLEHGRALRGLGDYTKATDQFEQVIDDPQADSDIGLRAAIELAILLACESNRPEEGRARLDAATQGDASAVLLDAARMIRDVIGQREKSSTAAPPAEQPAWWSRLVAEDPETALSVALGVMEAHDLSGHGEHALIWRRRATELGDNAPLDEAAISRVAVSLLRSANAMDMREQAANMAAWGRSLSSLPKIHPVALEVSAQLAVAFSNVGAAAYAPVLADHAFRWLDSLDPAALRVRGEVRAAWEECQRPRGRDVTEDLRAFVIPNTGFGLWTVQAADGEVDLFSCVMRMSTARDLIGALAEDERDWINPNVGLTVTRESGGATTLTFAATQPGARDYRVTLTSEDVDELHTFARDNGVAPPAFVGVGRNEPCPCGSRKKFKRCCGAA